MHPQQVLKRIFLGIRLVDELSVLDGELGGDGQIVDSHELVPVASLGEIERGHRVEQLGRGVGELNRLGPQPLLQQPVAPAHPLVDLDARLAVGRRQRIEGGAARLVARLHKRADLIDDLVVIGH